MTGGAAGGPDDGCGTPGAGLLPGGGVADPDPATADGREVGAGTEAGDDDAGDDDAGRTVPLAGPDAGEGPCPEEDEAAPVGRRGRTPAGPEDAAPVDPVAVTVTVDVDRAAGPATVVVRPSATVAAQASSEASRRCVHASVSRAHGGR